MRSEIGIEQLRHQKNSPEECFKNLEGPEKQPGGLECQELDQDFCNYDSTGC